MRREHPEYLEEGGWSSPTSYASLRELRATRGIRPATAARVVPGANGAARGDGSERRTTLLADGKGIDLDRLADAMTRNSQKKVVVLINEGTGAFVSARRSHFRESPALVRSHPFVFDDRFLFSEASAAEVFASALHDNGRTVALVGTKTFGKGLIQHTFPMPDGGGLRLTVAEYLTPSLQHVTKVGGAKYDSGVKPDVRCESKGIPQNVGADLCVGVALDVLESSD